MGRDRAWEEAVTWPQIAWMTLTSIVVLWWIWRSRGQHRGGYLLALDHVEEMTRPGQLTTHTLDDALRKLREEAKR